MWAPNMYRTSLLKGVWQHAPYFHDGSAATLDAVVSTYNTKREFGLTPPEASDLAQYLHSLQERYIGNSRCSGVLSRPRPSLDRRIVASSAHGCVKLSPCLGETICRHNAPGQRGNQAKDEMRC